MDPQTVYLDTVRALRELGTVLRPAVEARWEAPPGAHLRGDHGAPADPTGATVADVRRSNLSDEVMRAEASMIRATREIDIAKARVDSALRAWEGEPVPAVTG